jgi:hypothetical protein
MTLRADILGRHIDALDFLTFRELAQECLKIRGFSRSTISDGVSDGGRDIRVYDAQFGLQTIPFAVQTSVERKNWKGKIKEDAKRALDKLKCSSFLYVTSHRLPDAEFQGLVDSLRSDIGVTLTKMDQQDIAALLLAQNIVSWFFSLVGIQVESSSEDAVTIRQEVVEAFVLFSSETQNFRQTMVEQAGIVCAVHAAPCTRVHLERSMKVALGISGAVAEVACAGAVDRLLQYEQLHSKSGIISVDPEVKRNYVEARELAETQWGELVENVRKILGKYVSSAVSRESAKRLASQIGRILLAYREYQAAVLESSSTIDGKEKTRYLSEIRACVSFAIQEGVPSGKAEDFIGDLSELADSLETVGRLTAGEVFRRLVSVDKSGLIRALGGSRSLEIYLEPSVAIPLICAKLFGGVTDRFGRIVLSLYDFSEALGAKLLCPDVYIEESAAHLIDAASYQPIVEAGEIAELAGSENAFVSFYARLNDPSLPFMEFLKSFGFRGGTGDFRVLREVAIANLTGILKRYKINFTKLAPNLIREGARVRAEEDLAYIYREMKESRPAVLIRHDARVLSFLRSRALESGPASILATWDRTLLQACKKDQLDWWALEPSSLADLLSLTNTEGTAIAAVSWEISLSMSKDAEEKGARIWDALVKLEGEGLRDADRLARAQVFRQEYLERQQGVSFQRIKTDWLKWNRGENEASGKAGIKVAGRVDPKAKINRKKVRKPVRDRL